MENNKFNENDQDDQVAKFLAKFDRIKTSEEIEKEKEEYKKEILSKGFLPINDELNETMNSSVEAVEKNPRTFIIEECVPACKELWEKNIYTFMVSNHLNEGVCWIEVILDNLSDENKRIFAQLEGEDIIKFSYHEGSVNFGVKCVGAQAQARLLELAQKFQMQDVPYGEAYITLPEYLISCGCYDEVENPNYVPMTEPWNMDLPMDQIADYVIKYDEWKDSDKSKKTHKVFNQTKMAKPLEEYFDGTGVVYDGDRVYLSDYHYKKHMNYVNSLEKTQGSKHKK